MFVERTFGCSAEAALAVAQRATERIYAARAVLAYQGEPCSQTWLVLAGRVQALVYGAEGQQAMLGEYAAGELFGAIAQLDGAPLEADLVAVERLRAAIFLAADFVQLIETHGAIGLAVSRMLLRQLRQAAGRMMEQVTLSSAGRVCAELLRLAERGGDGVLAIRPSPVLSTLAVRVHTTRETASRVVSALERRGVIRRDPGALVIVSQRRMEEEVL